MPYSGMELLYTTQNISQVKFSELYGNHMTNVLASSLIFINTNNTTHNYTVHNIKT